MNTTAVIGDVGGHVDQLRGCLARLGVTESVWPAGLHVVQVGDLFGGTSDDVEVAHLVQPHLYAGRWTQLAGNWELGAVGGPEVVNRHGVGADPEALSMFSRWWGAGLVRYATAVTARSGVTAVVTHAGVTRQWLERFVHGPHTSASLVVTAINNAPPAALHAGGEMCQQGPRSGGQVPSPVWASTRELWSSWASTSTPWPQVHGHTTSWDWRRRRWMDWVPSRLAGSAEPIAARRHVRFQPVGHAHPIWAVDPGLWAGAPQGALTALVVSS